MDPVIFLKKITIKKLVLAVAIIEPLMTIPQIYNIWVQHQTAGVSLLTWLLFVFAAATWLIYGLKIKDLPLIISGGLWVIVELAVVIGLLID